MANTHSIDLESGSSQYLSITDASQTGLDLTGDCTIEMWLKFETDNASNLVTKWNSGANQRSYILEMRFSPATAVGWNVSNNGTTSELMSVNWNPDTATWYHVAVTYDASASTMELWIATAGGSHSSQGTSTGALTSIFNGTADFNIGALNGGGGFFDGLIDDVRIWDDIRTSTELDANFETELDGTEANLQAYWKFNNDATDTTSNGNDLTENASPVYSTDVPFTDTGISASRRSIIVT